MVLVDVLKVKKTGYKINKKLPILVFKYSKWLKFVLLNQIHYFPPNLTWHEVYKMVSHIILSPLSKYLWTTLWQTDRWTNKLQFFSWMHQNPSLGTHLYYWRPAASDDYGQDNLNTVSPVKGSVCFPYLNEILAIKFCSLLQITNSSAVGIPSWTKICA